MENCFLHQVIAHVIKKQMHDSSTNGKLSVTANGSTIVQHPFTCIVAGCTQSGKTVWVKTLLENVQTTISPSSPEFNQGIPEDIDEPDYLDVSQRNLIVLVDLMAQSGKDKRIADLDLQEEVITGICPLSTLSKIYFIKARKEKHQPQCPLYRTVQVTKG